MSSKLIAVFVSTHETLRAERALKKAGVRIRSTVKPRSISASCQLALTFAESALDDVRRVIKTGGFEFSGLYRQAPDGGWEKEPDSSQL